MTAVNSGSNESGRAAVEEVVAVEEDVTQPAVPHPLTGDPMALGLPTFIVGSIALGLVLVGVVPATATGASLPIILAATATGVFLAAIWAAALGQSAVASVFGIFGGFWLSYAVLVLGLTHNWFGITAAAAQSTQELFLVSWLVVIVMLTLATLRLPIIYTLLFALVDLALLLVFLGVNEASTGVLKAGGYVILVFAAVGVYLFFHMAQVATGGPAMPLGRPLLRT
jgi:uncharacterized protein